MSIEVVNAFLEINLTESKKVIRILDILLFKGSRHLNVTRNKNST